MKQCLASLRVLYGIAFHCSHPLHIIMRINSQGNTWKDDLSFTTHSLWHLASSTASTLSTKLETEAPIWTLAARKTTLYTGQWRCFY